MSFLVGRGSNGKSTILLLVKEAFGPYLKEMESHWITSQKGNPDGNTNQLVHVEQARLVVLSELNEDEKLNKQHLKKLTSVDSFLIRALYEPFRGYKPKFKPILFTNYMPMFTGEALPADKRRIRVYEMTVEYVDQPDPANPLQRKIDRRLEQDVAKLADAFLGLLFGLYNTYLERESVSDPLLPAAMVEATMRALERGDVTAWLEDFVNATYERTDDQRDYVTTKNVLASLAAEDMPGLPQKQALLDKLDLIFAKRHLRWGGRKFTDRHGKHVSGWQGWSAK